MSEQEAVSLEKEEIVETPVQDQPEAEEEAPEASQEAPVEKVPLHVLQKERRKRQEMEERLRRLEEQRAKEEYDETAYEPVTRADLGKSTSETVRMVEERLWIRNNPEKFEKINELLPEFLKQKPNLAPAIGAAPNRYEEAWELMDKLSPKQKKVLNAKAVEPKAAPGSPASVPKAAALNETIDVMNMSDDEFSKWRSQKRRGR